MRWFIKCLPWLVAFVLAAPLAYAAKEEAKNTAALKVKLLAPQLPKAVKKLLLSYVSLFKVKQHPVPEGVYSALALQRRAEREMRAILKTEGWFEPQIRFVDVTSADDGAAKKRWQVHVDPGQQIKIGQVQIDFDGALADAEHAAWQKTLRGRWSLPVGAVFRQAAWDGAKQNLLGDVAAESYASARIAASQAQIDTERAVANLQVTIDSGPVFYLGKLEVSGIERLPDDLVARFSDLREGERFSSRRLFDLQSELQNTPYFNSVIVDVPRQAELAPAVPVRVKVEEADSRKLAAGLGYTTNTGARFEVNWRDVNLRQRAWELATGLRVEQKEQTLYADLIVPPRKKGYRDSFGMLLENSDTAGVRIRSQTLGVTRQRSHNKIETALSLRWQNESTAPQGGLKRNTRSLSLDYHWKWRNVDNVLDPRRGLLVAFNAGGGLKAFLSDQNFFRLSARVAYYQPLGKRDNLILRAEMGRTLAKSRYGIPQDFLFRSGGAQSVRGYEFNTLGVKEGRAILGGRYLTVGSVEYVHWLDEKWGLAAFVDVGDATDALDDYSAHWGYGIGGRWRSPAGPMALDIAYGQKKQQIRLHFGIAVAF